MIVRQEVELPVYERLADVRSRAVTMGTRRDSRHAQRRHPHHDARLGRGGEHLAP